MQFMIAAVCDKGCVRQNNEDMILIGDQFIRDANFQVTVNPANYRNKFFIAVADGVGGANAGEVASRVVLEMISDGIMRLWEHVDDASLKAHIETMCRQIHKSVLQAGLDDPKKKGMGTTLIGLLYYEGRFILINAGDSRLYRYRNNTLTQLSRDHSLREVSGNREVPSNIIVNSFGGGNAFYVDIELAGKKILDGDLLLLCSDGVTDMLADEDIEDILARDDRDQELLNAAKNRGGKDNISYIVLSVSGVEQQEGR